MEQYTLKEFAELQGVAPATVRVWMNRNSLPDGFKAQKLSERKTLIVKDSVSTGYIHPNKLSAEQRVSIENAIADTMGNLSATAKLTGLHYTTVYRYIQNQFKDPEQPRSDKGISRRLSAKQIKVARTSFEDWFLKNAQRNVTLASEKVKRETGISIPRRIADKFAQALNATHDMKHYYKEFISRHTYHVRRDNWFEVKNFLDVVVSDVWKIDDTYLSDDLKAQGSTAYALVFIDQKTRYPLEIAVCPHSVTASDVKKGMLRLIMNYGEPGQWLLDNGHEFINKDVMDFLYGIYMNRMEQFDDDKRDKVVVLKEDEKLLRSRPYHPQGKGTIERTFRILKDEWASYSESYSPNQKDSRKPELKLSNVKPTQSFEELAVSLREFVYGDFLTRERSMFLSPHHSVSHDINSDRPVTIKEAYERAYSTYSKRTVDEFLLAFHYADKRIARYYKGAISFVDKLSGLKFEYIPETYDNIIDFSGEKVTVLINPQNVFHSWIYADGRLLCEAKDMRFKDVDYTKERATTLGKLQRKVTKLERERIKKIQQVERNSPEPQTAVYSEQTKESETELINDFVPDNNSESDSSCFEDEAGLWDTVDEKDLFTN